MEVKERGVVSALKNVLIVDDEKHLLAGLSEGLSMYAGEFNVLTADSGERAVEMLDSVCVDMLVTDLRMPGMDGIELLSFMAGKHPDVPVVVMTAYSTPDIRQRVEGMGALQYLEKPFDVKAFADMILAELCSGSEGRIYGVTLPAFLQLIEMERKTCTLSVRSADAVGRLYLKNGELLDAEAGALKGREAACEIICWEKPDIEISSACERKKRSIQTKLTHLLMEAFRQKDERARDIAAERRGRIGALLDTPDGRVVGGNKENPMTKEEQMSLETHLQGLRDIKGYKAAGIMNFTGEMLAADSMDQNINLGMVGATFNDIFRSAHEASKKIGLDACNETVISTPKGVIVMRCSGTDAKAHFHVLGIMQADGNQALMKMQLNKMMPDVMKELA